MTTWTVERIHKVIDGDTVRLVRSRTCRLDGLELTARDAGPNGVLARLAWLDTPERGQAGYDRARADLSTWLVNRTATPLTVVCFDGGAGWDRILVDLQDATGNSASQWLMQVCGWPPYGGAA